MWYIMYKDHFLPSAYWAVFIIVSNHFYQNLEISVCWSHVILTLNSEQNQLFKWTFNPAGNLASILILQPYLFMLFSKTSVQVRLISSWSSEHTMSIPTFTLQTSLQLKYTFPAILEHTHIFLFFKKYCLNT